MSYVLLADDDDAYAEAVIEMLSAKGYEAERARDAAQSVALLARRLPHLAIVDMQMTGGGGPAVVRAVREIAPHRPPPVIVCSSMPAEQTRKWFDSASGLTILQKPVSLARLGAEVERLILTA